MQTSDWMILNSVIYDIYTTQNFAQMCQGLLSKMTSLLDFDFADIYLIDPANPQQAKEVIASDHNNVPHQAGQLDYLYQVMQSAKPIVIRESDLVSDIKRQESSYYHTFLEPRHLGCGLHLVLASENEPLGLVSFYRNEAKQDFVLDDVFKAETLKDHLSWKAASHLKSSNEAQKSVEDIARQYHLTRQEKRVLSMTLRRKTNQEICEELAISLNTLKKHILNIYRKLGVRSRMELFKMAKGEN